MKKIIFYILLLPFLFSTVLYASAESETSESKYINQITDETTIKEDIETFGLNYSDYVITGNNKAKLEDFYDEKGYSEQFVIFVAENYSVPFSTYVYCYNPLFFYGDINVVLYISLNDGAQSITKHYNNAYMDMELIKTDEAAGIVCFKIPELFKITDLVRKYSIDINNSGMDTFECTYVTEFDSGLNRIDNVNYDSMIYILNDVVVPVIIETFTSWVYLFEKNPLSSQVPIRNEILSKLGITQSNYKPQIVYFYNFSADKRIDQILMANMSWDSLVLSSRGGRSKSMSLQEQLQYVNSKQLDRGDAVFHINNKAAGYNGEWCNCNKDVYWHKNSVEVLPTITEFPFNGKKVNINAFQTPASNRLKELNVMEVDKLTNEDKANFNNYDHSIMFCYGDYGVNYPGSNPDWRYTLVDNVRLTKLVYETDGRIYSSIVVDNDGPDTPTEPLKPGQNLEKTWIEKLMIWLGKKTIEFLHIHAIIPEWGYMTIGGVELGLLSVVAVVLFITFFPQIISLLIKLILLPYTIFKKISG